MWQDQTWNMSSLLDKIENKLPSGDHWLLIYCDELNRDHGDISYEHKEVGDEIECFDGLKIKQG